MTQHVNICQWSRSDGVLICTFLYNVAMKLLNTNHQQTATFRQRPLAASRFSSWKGRIRTHENLRFPCLAMIFSIFFYFSALLAVSQKPRNRVYLNFEMSQVIIVHPGGTVSPSFQLRTLWEALSVSPSISLLVLLSVRVEKKVV